MGADDGTSSNTSQKGDEAFASRKAGINKDELNEHLREYINEWKKTRLIEEEELKRLKEKQMKRKEIRAEQERKLNLEKKEEEEKLKKIEAEKKAQLEEEKKRQMEEAEKKRQEASDGKGKGKAPIDAHKEMTKTKEQVEEEMKVSLMFRIKPLALEEMDSDELKSKASELFNTIILLETEKYDAQERQIQQDYDMKELKERQKVQLRQKAAKKGLDPEAFCGKHPPTIRMFSKYERRTDTRTYSDRKGLYEGGWEVVRAEALEVTFKDKLDEWNKRHKTRLPKWFGERPGKKAGDPETPEEEEEE